MAESPENCYKSTVKFPVIHEILENIFERLDGQSLCVCELVSNHWNDVISTMKKVWRQFCTSDIPTDTQKQLSDTLIPNWSFDNSCDNDHYYNLYHLWFNWAYLLKKNAVIVRSTQNMKLGCNKISCLAVSGETVITGHERGTVCLWLSVSLPFLDDAQKPSPMDSVLCHRNAVTDIGLIYKSGQRDQHAQVNGYHDSFLLIFELRCSSLGPSNVNLCYQGLVYNTLASVFTLDKSSNFYEFSVDENLKHNFLITTSDNCVVRLCKLERMKIVSLQVLSRNLVTRRQISVFDDQFAILENHLVISLWRLNDDGVAHVIGHEDYWRGVHEVESLSKISMYDGEVYGFSDEFDFFKIDYQTNRLQKIYTSGICDKMARCTYLWGGSVAAVISIRYIICISIRDVGDVQYNVYPIFSSCPYSLHFNGRTFLVGTDAGTVYAYIINDKADLLKLDFRNYVCKWNLSENPIIHLETGMTSEGLCIYACSSKHLYSVTFQFEKESNMQ